MRNRVETAGFTIFELMIATVIFGALLTMLTFTTIRITNQFYRGVNQSRTQQVARTIVDQIGRSIQFSSGSVTNTPPDATNAGLVCTTDRGFNYVLFQQLSEVADAAKHRSTRTTAIVNSSTPCGVQPRNSLNGDELLSSGMRLTKVEVAPVPSKPGLWTVTVRVVYGDDDLLIPSYNDPNATCKTGAGSQFCAVSQASVTVFKRL